MKYGRIEISMTANNYVLDTPEDIKYEDGPAEPRVRVFTTTRWSMVIAASDHQSEEADAALEKLCRDYWQPVFGFIRRSGCSPHDAEDLTQAFFERVLSKQWLSAVDRRKGKFRSFLLAMVKNFLANHRRDARTLKRGGRFEFVSFEADTEDTPSLRSSIADASAVQSFDRQWALTLLEQVMARLRQEHMEEGKTDLFEHLKVFLMGDRGQSSYAEAAAKLDKSEAALKMTVSRMRRRYGELLREEIARTVITPQEVDEELRALFAAIV